MTQILVGKHGNTNVVATDTLCCSSDGLNFSYRNKVRGVGNCWVASYTFGEPTSFYPVDHLLLAFQGIAYTPIRLAADILSELKRHDGTSNYGLIIFGIETNQFKAYEVLRDMSQPTLIELEDNQAFGRGPLGGVVSVPMSNDSFENSIVALMQGVSAPENCVGKPYDLYIFEGSVMGYNQREE